MGSRGHSEGITMSGGGLYSLATIGAKHVIDAATPIVIEVINSLPQDAISGALRRRRRLDVPKWSHVTIVESR